MLKDSRKEVLNMKVCNMTSVNGNSVPNQFIITSCGGNTVTFQSYDSMIATIYFDRGIIEIGDNWNYSKTTGKYRNIFFKRYIGYQLETAKDVAKALEKGSCGDWIVKRADW